MMHAIAAVLPQFLVLVALLVLAYVPLGNWMARSYTSERDWAVERGIYAILRVDPSRGTAVKTMRVHSSDSASLPCSRST